MNLSLSNFGAIAGESLFISKFLFLSTFVWTYLMVHTRATNQWLCLNVDNYKMNIFMSIFLDCNNIFINLVLGSISLVRENYVNAS